MPTKEICVQDLKVGDKLLWKPGWNGYRFHPGPLTVTKTWPQSTNVEVAEGSPAQCQYDFNSFFCYGYGTYECPNCGHTGYLRSQEEDDDVICRKCYGSMKWKGLSAKF